MSEKSDEADLKYFRQNALNLTYMEENEECEEENEAEKLISGKKIFRQELNEKNSIVRGKSKKGLASKFSIRTCAI